MTAPSTAADDRGTSPHTHVLVLTVGIVLLTWVLTIAIPDPAVGIHPLGWWFAPLIALAFTLSERLVFHIEVRNEAMGFSPSDIPLAFGVLVLSPFVLVGARLIGAAVGLTLWRRPPLVKLVFNLVTFTAETLIVVVIFRSVFGTNVEGSLTTWLGLAAAMYIGLVIGVMLITVAISCFEGDLLGRARKELANSLLFLLPGAALGASAAVPLLVSPWLPLLFFIPAPLVWIGLRSHGALMHKFSDLNDIHEFSGLLGRSARLEDIADTAVVQIAGHLRADGVALVVWDADGSTLRRSNSSRALLDQLPAGPGDSDWMEVVEDSEPVAIDVSERSDLLAQRLCQAGVRQVIAVPLFDGAGCMGVLVAADRHGAVDWFGDDDLQRLRALSRQLAVAIRKGQLHVQIQHEATHDRLTGLPNRAYFEAWAAQAFGREAAMLLIDLDDFKRVNDTFGHHTGDELLIEMTRRINGVISDGSMAFRFGGDEFAVAAPGAGPDAAVALAEAVSVALERSFRLGGAAIAIAASIGIAISSEHECDVAELMRRADLAMHDAKQHRERYVVFDGRLEATDSVRLEMLGELRESLGNETLRVHFQPMLDLRTNEVVAVESLARWTHPTRGVVPPDVFIPLAEQVGLIGDLTSQVLDRSLEAVVHWADQGHRIRVAINVSAQSLISDQLPRMVAGGLERANVQPHMLTIEITESVMIDDDDRARQVLESLARLGVQLSIDDFGTGHSSLINLRRLPLAELKVDRAFVAAMQSSETDEVIVRATIDLAHNLGLSVVAEGVETPEQQEALRAMGCDMAQGYGICRPVPLEEFDKWLLARNAATLAVASPQRVPPHGIT